MHTQPIMILKHLWHNFGFLTEYESISDLPTAKDLKQTKLNDAGVVMFVGHENHILRTFVVDGDRRVFSPFALLWMLVSELWHQSPPSVHPSSVLYPFPFPIPMCSIIRASCLFSRAGRFVLNVSRNQRGRRCDLCFNNFAFRAQNAMVFVFHLRGIYKSCFCKNKKLYNT